MTECAAASFETSSVNNWISVRARSSVSLPTGNLGGYHLIGIELHQTVRAIALTFVKSRTRGGDILTEIEPVETAMRADQIMTRKVITVTPDTTITDAANTMLQNHVSGLPVVDASGNVIGILSEGDFLRRAEIGTKRKRSQFLRFILGPGQAASDFVHEHGRKVSEIMTTEPMTITEDTPLDAIVTLMEKNKIKRLPVTRGDHLVGIVSRANLLQAVASLARDMPDPTADDDQIRDHVIDILVNSEWCPFGLNVAVRDGIVHLSGVITEERARQAAVVAAENVGGVKKVRDHLCWIDTLSGVYLNSPEDDELAKAS